MFKIGDHVRVIKIIDPDVGYTQATMDCVGEGGVIVETDTRSCGATAEDPFFSVLFANGHKDSFWGEELEFETTPPKVVYEARARGRNTIRVGGISFEHCAKLVARAWGLGFDAPPPDDFEMKLVSQREAV